MKAPTQLILAASKCLKGDMSQAKHYADECFKVLHSAESSQSRDDQVKILIPYLNLCMQAGSEFKSNEEIIQLLDIYL